MSRKLALGAIGLVWIGSFGLWSAGGQEPRPVVRPVVDEERKVVTIPVVLGLKRFRGGWPPGHHLITWEGGKAGGKPLLQTPVPDGLVLEALESLGAKPGNNLREEAWTQRKDPKSKAPDVRAEGTRLTLTLVLADGKRRPVTDLLVDVDEHGYQWRLAGNRKLIGVWRSGCVVCLQSCPGSKIANARATMRDLEQERSRFRPSKLASKLGEGARLKVEIRFAPKEKAGSQRARQE
ncbi:MAG TPA: hypothetical protein DEA08_06305 [Planctomycetes bacterium]|nr:hypothetical protein [Planctomycetota bacterium]